MQLQVTQVSNKTFMHDAVNKCLIAEISDLGNLQFQQLYDDAADVGIALRNAKTGNVTRWYLAGEMRCGTVDNEVVGWQLYPCPETVLRNPETIGYDIQLLND